MSLVDNRLDHFQEGSFAWFTGVVEDVLDPQELGRVRVRCFGYHTEDREQIPTDTLPWSMVMTPITNPAMDSIGQSSTGVLVGTWVVGFFRDGKSAQDPVVIGTLPSKTSNISPTRGFSDQTGTYPKRIFAPDIPLESRTGFEKSGSYTDRVDSRVENIETAIPPNVSTVDPTAGDVDRQTWSSYLQEDYHKSVYPFNNANKTVGGHLIEIDNTEGYKRLLTQHASGTYDEIVNDGTKATVVKGNKYTVVFQNDNVYIKGNCNLTVDGDVKTLIKGNYHLEVEGDYTQNIKGNKRTKVGANQYEEIDFHYSRNIGRTHSDRIGTDSTIIIDNDMNLVVANNYTETINNDYLSKVTNNRTSDTFANNDEFVSGNSEITVNGNYTLRTVGNINMNSVGSTAIAATASMTFGTGGPAFLNVGTTMTSRILGANNTFITGSNYLAAATNTMTASNHIFIGDVTALGTISNVGNVTSTGTIQGADCLTFAGKSLNLHKHGVPASGPTTTPI